MDRIQFECELKNQTIEIPEPLPQDFPQRVLVTVSAANQPETDVSAISVKQQSDAEFFSFLRWHGEV
jgi:hypothetical protein